MSTRIREARAFRMDPGPYAFGEAVELRLCGQGKELYLWVGITSQAGIQGNDRCLGVMPSHLAQSLAAHIAQRSERPPTPRAGPVLGRAASAIVGRTEKKKP